MALVCLTMKQYSDSEIRERLAMVRPDATLAEAGNVGLCRLHRPWKRRSHRCVPERHPRGGSRWE